MPLALESAARIKFNVSHPRSCELVAQRGVHIEMPLRFVTLKLAQIKPAKFVVSRLDIRAHEYLQLRSDAAEALAHHIYRIGADPPYHARAPRMHCGNHAARNICDQYGRAVRYQHAQRHAAQIGHEPVAGRDFNATCMQNFNAV